MSAAASTHVFTPGPTSSLQFQKTYFPGLDLIRCSAALLVLFFHLAYQSRADPLATFASIGWLGVPIFFVLSGFVIAFSANGRSAGQFVKSRIFRLYPAAWICGSATAIFILHDPQWVENYIKTMVLLPIGPWVDAVYWTLAVEIAFYFSVAVVLALWGSRMLTRLGLILGLASSAFWFLRLVDFATGRNFQPIFTVFESELGNLFLLKHGCYFAMGVLLWSIRQNGLNKTVSTAL